MRSKAKSSIPKLGLPLLVFSCLCFFIAGFFASIIFSQDAPAINSRLRMLEVVTEDGVHEPMQHGETGEPSVGSIPFQVLSWKPRALYFPNFATAEQCQAIVKMAKAHLKPSLLALREGETTENTEGIRTRHACYSCFSLRIGLFSGTFISASEDQTGTLDYIERKIARVTMIPRTHGEAFNILRYKVGQKYDSHYDAFNPAEYGPQSSQRIASLNRGGDFDVLTPQNGLKINPGFSYKKCTGLKVKPRRGDGLLFYSVFPNGTIDQSSLHGSCPVIKGEKWVATKWLNDQEEADE
ncbi:hypothetical protein CDL15_Pgr003344 [Punica granatum]|uniref:Fe2OG dioxygenase domain-containing protein n=1 Tax=Punica granatum TaxID=22663 RepID=A0A218X2J0_PUNGR|nr:hypothetical protein CDL15_Pgr003344 [Punica granatum]